jgi:hypothetical protein
MGVMGTKTLREYIPDACSLKDCPYRTTRNQTSTGTRRFQKNSTRTRFSDHFIGNGRFMQIDFFHIPLGLFNSFSDGVGDLVRFSKPASDCAVAVPDNNNRAKTKPTSALHYLCHPIDMDYLFY